MKIIFIISSTILFIADFAFAQDQNYGNNQTDQIIDDIRKYQLDYYNPNNNKNSSPYSDSNYFNQNKKDLDNGINSGESNISSEQYNLPYNYHNKTKSNKIIDFNDGKGSGFRVYDNSNRQSYYCGLDQNKPLNFTHDNNFNGVYFGLGINSTSNSLSTEEDLSIVNNFSNSDTQNKKRYQYDFSGNKINPTITIGQGRLFSSGFYLGQEFTMIVGDIGISKDNLKPTQIKNNDNSFADIKKIQFIKSNMSYYSGKFGYNIFENFLPYLKLGLSFSSSKFIIETKNNKKYSSEGGFIAIIGGLGVDISISDHVRLMLDYSVTKDSGEDLYFINNYTNYRHSAKIDNTISMARLNAVWRF